MENLSYIYTTICRQGAAISDRVALIQERNKFFCKAAGIDYRIEYFDAVEGENIAQTSDKERFTRACRGESCIYIDWDVFLVDIPPLNPSKPLLGQWSDNSLDSFILYSGNRPDLFKDFFLYVEEKKYGIGFFPAINEYLCKYVGIYPAAYYRHYNTDAWRSMGKYNGKP